MHMIQMPCRQALSLMLIVILLLANTAVARRPHSGNRDSQERNKVSLKTRLSQDRFHPGSDILAVLVAEIQEGWHINSSTPADENSVETSVQARVPKGVRIDHIRYPAGIEQNFDFAEFPLNVYEGTIYIVLKLSLASDLRPGSYTVPLQLRYQACSDKVCLAPATVSADLRLQVVAAGKKVSRINKEIFEGLEESNKP